MSFLGISQYLSILQPVVGLVLVVMGFILLRRQADPAVKLLIAWGGLWVLGGHWRAFTALYFRSTSGLPPAWFNVVSSIELVGGRLFLFATAFYAVWRLWSASGNRPNSSAYRHRGSTRPRESPCSTAPFPSSASGASQPLLCCIMGLSNLLGRRHATLQYDLVVSDMDGTLLRDDKTLSARTVRAVRRFEEAGGRFTIATGRGLAAMQRFLEQLQTRTPLLLLNGCLGYDPVTGHDIFRHELPRPVLETVWPTLLEHGLDLVVHGPRRGLIRGMNEIIAEHLVLDGITVDEVPDMSPANLSAVVKILTIGEPPVLDRAEAAIVAAGAPVQLVRSHPKYLEVLPPEGGKGHALTTLLEHLQIPVERSVAVGDFLNDLEIVQTAGLGVAMANAHPGLKAVAGWETLSNMEDGVAAMLEALVEGRPIGP